MTDRPVVRRRVRPGNTLDTAKVVTSLPYTKTGAGVGGVDTADDFQITAPDYTYVTLDLTGSTSEQTF